MDGRLFPPACQVSVRVDTEIVTSQAGRQPAGLGRLLRIENPPWSGVGWMGGASTGNSSPSVLCLFFGDLAGKWGLEWSCGRGVSAGNEVGGRFRLGFWFLLRCALGVYPTGLRVALMVRAMDPTGFVSPLGCGGCLEWLCNWRIPSMSGASVCWTVDLSA